MSVHDAQIIIRPQSQEDETEAALKRRIRRLEGDLEDARADLERERQKSTVITRAMHSLRGTLNPLYKALQMIYGDLDTLGQETPTESAQDGPLDAARYAPWKEKYRGQTASAIDILVKYEAGLSRKQLASFLRVEPGSGTMSQIIFKLNKAELIVKDGNLIRLKRL